MADLDLNELRRIAEEATPGPWGRGCDGEVARLDPYDREMDEHITTPDAEADAEHITAFDPPTVLALLERIESLEADRERLVGDDGLLSNALRDNKNLAATAARLEAERDRWESLWDEQHEKRARAEARLARVTDDSAEKVGWYEFASPIGATTHVVYVYEDGSRYFPEGLDVADDADFLLAESRGRSWRLIRAVAADEQEVTDG